MSSGRIYYVSQGLGESVLQAGRPEPKEIPVNVSVTIILVIPITPIVCHGRIIWR